MSDDNIPEGAPVRAEPQTFRGRLLAVSITAKDVVKSVEWYRDVVGFSVQDEHRDEGGTLLAAGMVAGEVHIRLNQDDGAKGWDRTKGEGISLYIPTVQDVDEVAGRIKAAGGELAMEPTDMPWGTRAFRLVDPDGFQITIARAMD